MVKPGSPKTADTLASQPFSYQLTKSGSMQLYARGQIVKTLKGAAAAKLQQKLEGAEPEQVQQLLARATGQFKFGNERR